MYVKINIFEKVSNNSGTILASNWMLDYNRLAFREFNLNKTSLNIDTLRLEDIFKKDGCEVSINTQQVSNNDFCYIDITFSYIDPISLYGNLYRLDKCAFIDNVYNTIVSNL